MSLLISLMLASVPVTDTRPPIEFVTLEKQPMRFENWAKGKISVVIFLSPECPISNGYISVLSEMQKQFAKEKVQWLLVYPEPIPFDKAVQHAKEFHVPGLIGHDHHGELVRRLTATMVPQAVVQNAEGKIVYRGRIDDRYTKRGGASREPRQHDLQEALAMVLFGKEPARSYVQPVGCPMPMVEKSNNDKTGAITYASHVAPILQERCVSCHRAGGVGPFTLTDYADAKSWAADMVALTASGQMPPWKPVAGHQQFQNDRRMTDVEKKTLADWLAANCPKGDDSKMPAAKNYSSEWLRGTPDLILQPSEIYELEASGKDEYRCFVLPTNFNEDKFVSAFEILPGNRKVVHHVLSFIDMTEASTRLDAADPKPGYSTAAGFPGFLPSGGLGGWAPGNTGRPLPDGTARLLPKGAKIVMQVHYHKSGKPEKDQTRLGLYFSKVPVERAAFDLMVVPLRARFGGLRIPPGDTRYECKASLTLTDDYFFYSVTPHMHLLGKEMQVQATFPDGRKETLIHINDWDFNWQESYRYKEPLKLPRGTKLDMVAYFDNSVSNPNNPSDPPRLVTWGEQTNDEMCICFFEVSFQKKAESPDELRPPRPGYLLRQQLGVKKNSK